ncbi:MAG: GAF domain-containing protein [Anaerolineae bacterium]|nr:GAF domain-containing protein [Anaerolineae bacterium]
MPEQPFIRSEDSHSALSQGSADLNERLTELMALHTLMTAVHRSLNLEDVLATALQEIETILGLAYSEIWLVDDLLPQINLAARHGLPESTVEEPPTFEFGFGLPGVAAQQGRPIFISDLATNPYVQTYRDGEIAQFSCGLGIPLLDEENLVGVIIFLGRTPNSFSPPVRDQLMTFSRPIATAIKNARQHGKTKQRANEQSALLAARTAIASSLDLATVLDQLAAQIAKAANVTSVRIFDWQPEIGSSTVLAEYFTPEASEIEQKTEMGKVYHLLSNFRQIGQWIQKGQVMIFHADEMGLPPSERTFLTRHGGLSTLLMPFTVKGSVIGWVHLSESRRRRDFTLNELALCQAIAQQGATALENARLFHQLEQEITERKWAEEKLARKAREAQLLDKIRIAVARELERSTLVESVVEAVANTLGYTIVGLYLLKGANLVLQHKVGPEQVTEHLSLEQSSCGYAVETGKPILIKNVTPADSMLSSRLDDINSEICVPLLEQDKVVGTLNVASKIKLERADLRLLTILCEYVSIALERTHLYMEARESEEKYRTLIEQSNDAIYLIHGNKFEIVNRKFEELFGVTQDEVNNPAFSFTNILANKNQRLVVDHQELETAKSNNDTVRVSPVYEFTARNKDGEEIEVELTVSYPTYKGRMATQGVLRDITDRKRAEAEKIALQAQMFQSAKLASVGELAAGIAHEINNPIFAIRQFAELMLEDTPTTMPTHSMLQTIIGEADRVATIVRNLLEFSRPSESSFGLVYLNDIWRPLCKLVEQSLQEHNVHLDVYMPDDLPPIRARGQQLQQVLLNLINNAIDALNEKYSDGQSHPQKRITVKAQLIAVATYPSHLEEDSIVQFIRLSIRDEGVGIPEKDREYLFTPFFTTKRPHRGTGLGLSISHKIIDEHQGKIDVNSEPGVFTEFVVTLPAEEQQQDRLS